MARCARRRDAGQRHAVATCLPAGRGIDVSIVGAGFDATVGVHDTPLQPAALGCAARLPLLAHVPHERSRWRAPRLELGRRPAQVAFVRRTVAKLRAVRTHEAGKRSGLRGRLRVASTTGEHEEGEGEPHGRTVAIRVGDVCKSALSAGGTAVSGCDRPDRFSTHLARCVDAMLRGCGRCGACSYVGIDEAPTAIHHFVGRVR